MKKNRLSFNILIVVVIIASALTFFVSVGLTKTAVNIWALNEFVQIEDSSYAVKYSNVEPNGIYKGTQNVNTLVIEGDYGADWGVSLDGNILYINEYSSTSLGFNMCDVVKIDLDSKEKEVICKDAVLRGKCKSGELVFLKGFSLQTGNPEANAFGRFYSLSSFGNDAKVSTVEFYDTEKGKFVYSEKDRSVSDKSFSGLYIERTLGEVRK